MTRLTPAQRFRLEEAKRGLPGYLALCGVVVLLAVCIAYAVPCERKQAAQWTRLPVQTAVGRVERVHAPVAEDDALPIIAAARPVKVTGQTSRGAVWDETYASGPFNEGDLVQVQYQHPSGDVRIVRLTPISNRR